MKKSLFHLFFGFTGRIPRKSWWPAAAVLFVASIGGSMLLDPQSMQFNIVEPQPSWPNTLWQLALVIPGTAITVKRFNDRSWPFWLGYLYGVAGVVLTVALHLGILDKSEPNTGEMIAILVPLAFYLFALIDNGFLRGTRGPNRYGPDPLGAQEATP
jgi:uncharacterized membrane protein YhaH (DUF805 family)